MSNEDIQEDIVIEKHEREAKKRLRQRRVRGKQVHVKRIHTFCRFLLSSLLFIGTYYFIKLPQWYIPQTAFTNSDTNIIKIYNNEIIPSERIYKLMSIYEVEHTPIFALKTDKLKKLLLELPPIDDVYIRRYAFPARLEIIVKERIPVVTISPELNEQPIAYFTQDGTLVGKEYAQFIDKFHTLLILISSDNKEDYHKWDGNNLNKFLDFAKVVEQYSGEIIEYIDYRNPEDVFVKINTAKLRIGKIDALALKRIKNLPAIIPEIKLMDSKIKYVDLRWEAPYLKLERNNEIINLPN